MAGYYPLRVSSRSTQADASEAKQDLQVEDDAGPDSKPEPGPAFIVMSRVRAW